ncbi:PiggyBac transposable element-derived protein 3 [Trichinella papuae]|uniref:PiggyBac transposable element-derived protein 3 n=1 Tax=Trichinella papuae TaxID=268474 RepID=A0A0V1M6Z1_9BILA|nr:PiggyBac transposable element-derived protein 3 [Trichinella papuae]
MVPYYGHHTSKMYIRGPLSSDGYPYLMNLYGGIDEKTKEPLGMRIKMISNIPTPEKHQLFFDNFFTSVKVVKTLAAKNIRTTGTIRAARVRDVPLLSSDIMEKKDSGFMDSKWMVKCLYADGRIAAL